MSPKTTVKSKETTETRDNKAVPGIAYRPSSSITLRSKFKVLKGGDTVALLIRFEAKLLIIFTWWTDVTGFAATVYAPAQVSLRKATIHFVLTQRLQRQSEEGKTIPA